MTGSTGSTCRSSRRTPRPVRYCLACPSPRPGAGQAAGRQVRAKYGWTLMCRALPLLGIPAVNYGGVPNLALRRTDCQIGNIAAVDLLRRYLGG